MITWRLTFLGLESFWWGTLLILCSLVAIGLIIAISRYERQLVSPLTGYGLVGLRSLLIFVLLVLALQPTITWTSQRKEQTRFLVALDVSESMDHVDEHASPAEKTRWAVGLGMQKAAAANDEQVESSTELQREEKATGNSQEEKSTAADHVVSRFELARQLMTLPRKGLLDRLKAISQTELLLFSRNVRGIKPSQLSGSREELSQELAPEITSYAELLQRAAAEKNCDAVILLTDGVDTAPIQPIEAAQGLAGQSRPVFSILTGSLNQPVDLAIESIDHPEMVYRQDQSLIRVRVGTHGFQNQPLTVMLTNVASGTRQVKEIVGEERFVDLEFDLKMTEPGRQRFVIDVQSRDSEQGAENPQGDEVEMSNNQQEFAIHVVDDTTNVLLVDGEGRWEFRFLESAFQRDSRVQLQAVLFEQPYLGLLPHSFFASSLPSSQHQTKPPFEETDLIILGDADPRDIEQITWEHLDRFVSEQGGTLVISAGKRHFASQMQNPVLQKMLPIEHYRAIEGAQQQTSLTPQTRGFHLQLTPQGKNHPLMKLDTDAGKNITAWESLPGHPWGLAGVPKPGAVMLATATGAVPVSSTSGPLGTIVLQNYGLGRVLWVGIDSTWRWRSRVGDRDHYRFWGQLTRWAAEMRSTSGSDEVRLGLDSGEVQAGEETIVRARWSSRMSQNVDEIQAIIEVYPRSGGDQIPLMSFPLEPLATQPLVHEGKTPPLPPGEYRLQLKAGEVPLGPEPIETELTIVPRKNSENSRLAADRTVLDQMAAITQGAVFWPDQLDDLLERLNPDARQLEEKQDIPLWNHWLVFVLILGLLGSEWFLRKWQGLP